MTAAVTGVVMCGGKGTRLDADMEKPLFEIAGTPMVDRTVRRLRASGLAEVYVVTSPHAPETAAHVSGRVPVVETPGDGFLPDLTRALEAVSQPTLSVPCDNVLVPPAGVDRLLDAFDGSRPLRAFTPARLNEALGMNVNDATTIRGVSCASTGVRVTPECGRGELRDAVAENGALDRHVTYDARFAVNVNTVEQARTAASLAPEPAGEEL